MRLSDLNQLREDSSATASSQLRTLAVAGLAAVWLFAGPFFQGETTAAPPVVLYVAGACLAGGLALDVLQFYVKAGLVQRRYRIEEKAFNQQQQVTEPEEFEASEMGKALHIATGILFYLKGVAVAVGFALLVLYFASTGHQN